MNVSLDLNVGEQRVIIFSDGGDRLLMLRSLHTVISVPLTRSEAVQVAAALDASEH